LHFVVDSVIERGAVFVLPMSTKALPVQFNAQLLAEDMALKGWNKNDIARRARVSDMTVIRFLRGERQSAKTAKRLATALGHSVRRYLIASSEAVA
jgi:transcriptional regulator with XRE-family HTH domain